ncbi:unnamed protein product [Plutella xylostella]|uniref:(diamondback moth) hypothetical protein n=1 Tax=Plutella xylostella TaxID=51655 RepID=A0A8S4GB49_PLUXY|nr:unnamed protein product [Plutella xylostella]
MICSISENTLKQYSPCIKDWITYCHTNQISTIKANIPEIIKYFTKKFNEGMSYGSLNSLRSALSLFLGSHIGTDHNIKRLFKGFFRLRPCAPKYDYTWNVSEVLEYIENVYASCDNLEICSKKTVTLLVLATGHRAQTICAIDIDLIKIESNVVHIKVAKLVKTSAPNRLQPFIRLPFFNDRPFICPARAVIDYLNMTKSIRKDCKNLFLSYREPYKPVTVSTISRWIKTVLQESGIDINTFSAHSTRHASTSTALKRGVSIDEIRRTAGWTDSSSCFARFYNRPVRNVSFAEAVFS